MHADADRSAEENEAGDDVPFDADTDPAPAGVDGNLDVAPGPGGYAGRDPKTEMPRVSSVPETRTIRASRAATTTRSSGGAPDRLRPRLVGVKQCAAQRGQGSRSSKCSSCHAKAVLAIDRRSALPGFGRGQVSHAPSRCTQLQTFGDAGPP